MFFYSHGLYHCYFLLWEDTSLTYFTVFAANDHTTMSVGLRWYCTIIYLPFNFEFNCSCTVSIFISILISYTFNFLLNVLYLSVYLISVLMLLQHLNFPRDQ